MKKQYTVQYKRDESGMWVATIPQLPGCITQGRSIAQARRRIRSAFAAYTGSASAAKVEFIDDVDLRELGESAKLVKKVLRERAELEARKEAFSRTTAEVARKLASAGLSVRDVGEILDVSHQRVQQLAGMPRAAHRAEPKRQKQ
jgi:predicted RNase H-like HicB family nuclease